MHINTIQQRSGNFGTVAADLLMGAAAYSDASEKSTGTRIFRIIFMLRSFFEFLIDDIDWKCQFIIRPIVVVKKTFRDSNVFSTTTYAALPNFGTLLWKTV